MAPCSENPQFTDSGRPDSLLTSTSSEGPLHSTVISDSAHFSFHSTCSVISDNSRFHKTEHTCDHCCHEDESVDYPLGERPSCEGRDQDEVTILSPEKASDLLDTDWDNSALDASCTTCAEREFSLYSTVDPEEISQVARPMKHLLFMKHTVTCPDCVQGKECPTAQAMEQDMSSFFEVDLGEEYYDNSVDQTFTQQTAAEKKSTAFWSETSYAVETIQLEVPSTTDYYSFKSDPTKSLTEVNLDNILAQTQSTASDDSTFRSFSQCDSTFRSPSQCDSALTTSSDTSDYMEKAQCKLPVTGNRCSCRKSVIVKKMKQFIKYMQQRRQNQHFKTLIVL